MKTNAIYCVSIASGSILSFLYCGFTVASKGDWPWKHGAQDLVKNIVATFMIGSFFCGSNVGDGAASVFLGELGTVVGGPIFVIGSVVVANISGIIQGEWTSVGTKAKVWMGIGLLLPCLSIVAFGL